MLHEHVQASKLVPNNEEVEVGETGMIIPIKSVHVQVFPSVGPHDMIVACFIGIASFV
jgi:hypothetical protein